MPTKPCLMVVDDDENLTALFCDAFEDRYAVMPRSSAHAALDGLLDRRPDVILLDFSMPGMNGIEALKAIKALDRDIPVIMVTGSCDPEVADEAVRLGAFAYLPKPFQIPYAEHLIAAALLARSSPLLTAARNA